MADRTIQGIAVEIRGDYRKLQADIREARKEVKASAEGMSNALNNALSPRQIESSVMSLTSNLKKIKSATSLAGNEFKSISADMQGMRSQLGLSEKSFANLQSRILKTKVADLNSRAIQGIARSANLGVVATASLQQQLGDTTGAFKTLSAGGVAAFNRVKNSVISFKTLLAGVAVGASFKSIFEAGRSYAALNRSITAISGSTEETNRQMEYLQRTSDDLGQNFFDLADSYRSYYAAAKQAGMGTEEVQRIFTGFTQAGAVQGLTAERMKFVFMALEQMISKGTVSMEELRRQLGDNLPGALGIAAEAMGKPIDVFMKMVASGEVLASDLLPKMVTILEARFKGGVDKATAAQNKFNEAWQKAKLAMADSGFLDSAVSSLQEITEYLGSTEAQSNLANLGTGFANLASGAAKTAVAMGKVASILSSLPPELLGAIAGAAIGSRIAGGYGALGGAAAGIGAGVGYRQDQTAQQEAARARAAAKDAAIVGGNEYRGGNLVGPGGVVDLEAEYNTNQGTTVASSVVPDSAKLISARNALAGLRREIELILAEQSGDPTASLLGIDDAYQDRIAKLQAEIAKPKQDAGTKAALQEQIAVEKQKYDIEREYAEKSILLAENVKAASMQMQLEELQGVDTLEAKKAEVRDKYAQMRLQPNSQEAQSADAMEQAEIAKLEREHAATVAGLRGEYAKLTNNSKEYQKALLDEIKAGITGNETLEQRLILQRQIADIEAKINGDQMYASRQALEEYADSATDSFQNAYDAAASFASSTEDALVDAAMGGADAFSRLADSIIEDFSRIAIRENITGPLFKSVSDSGGIFSFLGSFFHGGGVIGRDAPTFTRTIDPSVFIGAPRLHSGLMPDEFPAILQKGETVTPKGGFKSSGNGGSNIQVNIHNYSGESATQQKSVDNYGNARIDVMIGDAAAKQMATPGSSLNRAVRSTTGVRQQVVRR